MWCVISKCITSTTHRQGNGKKCKLEILERRVVMETASSVSTCCGGVKWSIVAVLCCHDIVLQISVHFNSLQTTFKPVCLLQVDLLKSTALPLMKKFGIDGEGFDLKVRT